MRRRAGQRQAGRRDAKAPVAVACLLASLVAPGPAHAVIDDSNPGANNCNLPRYEFKLITNATIVGIPLANSQVGIDATTAKLEATGVTANDVCETVFFRVTQFEWKVHSAPQGQSASISNGNTLSPRVSLRGPGIYIIRLTACPNKCRVTLDGRSRSVGPFRKDITITAQTDITVPPELEPPAQELLPLSRPQPPLPSFDFETRSVMCQGGGGVKDPQWVTVGPFNGPADYRLLEGPVNWSRVADLDNPLNHDTPDFEWKNLPDPPYFGLPHPVPDDKMKVEWETGSYPPIFNPTPGDRTSTFGFWIFDCGHDPFKGEIHPPVGVATERARPVSIPSSFRPPGYPNGLGSNLVVPGITTDVWFNRRSGETTRNCSATGLHQPATRVTVEGQPTPLIRGGACIREPHPLNRKFTFNVYLPRNPLLRARELGFNPPEMPLFIGIDKFNQGGGGAEPVIVRREAAGVTWLEVTLDLSTLQGDTYARRISAAWAYPSPDNWGASRWRAQINDMYVYDDAEPGFDDGDWRLDFNTNNRDQEWSKILDCDGCVDDEDTRRFNLRTGATLGPDPVVFPGQSILLHTVGFDDEVAGDDLGSITERVPQRTASYTFNAQNGEAAYRLNFSIRRAGAVRRPTLTREAGALFSAYTGKPNPTCQPTLAPAIAAQRRPGFSDPFCAPAQQDPARTMTDHPDNIVLRTPSLRIRKVEFDEPMEREEFALTGISTSALRRLVKSMGKSERDALFAEVTQDLKAVPARARSNYDELVRTFDRALSDRLFRQAIPDSFRKSRSAGMG